MSAEANKALYIRWIESGFNSGDAVKGQAAVDEFLSPNYTDHGVPPGFPRTIEAPKKAIAMYLSVFPDLHMEIEHLVSEGDMVVAHVRISGTHEATFEGVAATERKVSFPAFDMVRIADGKIVEHWFVGEFLGLRRQLGATS